MAKFGSKNSELLAIREVRKVRLLIIDQNDSEPPLLKVREVRKERLYNVGQNNSEPLVIGVREVKFIRLLIMDFTNLRTDT